MGYLLGIDLGSSSIKTTLLEVATGKVIASATAPETEMEIQAPKPGWAEQDPALWWENVKTAIAKIKVDSGIDPQEISAVGIAYQMHGLVLVDRNLEVLRPAIIWCDSRAVDVGNRAFAELGEAVSLKRLLNSPGNFTASKLKWVQENEPELYGRIYKAMLPGDYIGFMMTGEIRTTPSGLSEGILWDFTEQRLAGFLLDYYGISSELTPEVVPTFSLQGELTNKAAEELGLKAGIKVSYRAGDQPNNAFSLKVLNPGEIAATAGTSGVVYGVTEQANYDPKSRVNTFVHVNHNVDKPRYGILLCLNGAAILNRWLRHNIMDPGKINYKRMDLMAAEAQVGAEGLSILPYGNGAERTLENRDIGASIHGLDLNRHGRAHLLRAAQEGIVFALNYGLEIMREMGTELAMIKAGEANMFLSPIFTEAFATITGATVQLYNTDGSQGAARGAGVGAGLYRDYEEAFVGLDALQVIEPDHEKTSAYQEAYGRWREILLTKLRS